MSETRGDFPKPPEPQLGPRDVGYHPRQQEVPQPETPQSAPPAESQSMPIINSTPEPQARMGLRDRLANLGKRAAEVVALKPEPRLLPDQINARTLAQRMESVHDDRTLLGFTEKHQAEWAGYPTIPQPNSPEYQQWLEAMQAIRKANIEFDHAGITQQGTLDMPSGEKELARKIIDPAKFKQFSESKPVMQAHPNNQ